MLRVRYARLWIAGRAALAVAVLGLSACAVGRLNTQAPAGASAQESLHRDFLDEAAAISKSAWSEVRSSGSRVEAWATILLEGRDSNEGGGLAASSQASPAASYLAMKAQTYATPQAQLSAVVADLDSKDAEIDTFIGYVGRLSTDYQNELSHPQAAATTADFEERREALDADRHVVNHAVAELRSQMATYEAVERKLEDEQPDLDTGALAVALQQFSARIDQLAMLGKRMGARDAA